MSSVDRARLLFVISSATRAVGEVNITLIFKTAVMLDGAQYDVIRALELFPQ